MKIEQDATISHYKILSAIGKGGMGEVYLAQDTKLNRRVALKILPEEFAEDKERMGRFVREAQSVSALNHPNIITIHEIGEAEGTNYIATEFIDGKTLDEYAKTRSLNFSEISDIAIQIASALDEAHTAGIIHRDIKPDNVMIRENGHVKILDFGIAKLSEPPAVAGGLSVDSEDATAIQQPSTLPGMIIGTANYMSPEQAKGKEVDARTDIFSFGVVLYEMISGHLPFEGETPMEMIAAIINREPGPLRNSDVPPEIKRIVGKTLRKDRDERYQTFKGLLADLKEVRLDLDVRNKLEKTVQPESDRAEQQTQILSATTAGEQRAATAVTGQSAGGSPLWLKASGAVGLAVVVILAGWYFFAGDLFSGGMPFEKIRLDELANDIGSGTVAISPDGKLFAFSKVEVGERLAKKKTRLIVKRIDSAGENVIFDTETEFMNIHSFSPGGEYIYFLLYDQGKARLKQIPSLGGAPKTLIDGLQTFNVHISPDGKKAAYIRRSKDDQGRVVAVSNVDGSDFREAFTFAELGARSVHEIGWSPDSRQLVLIYRVIIDKKEKKIVATFDLAGDEKTERTKRLRIINDSFPWGRITGIKWLQNGKGIIVAAETDKAPRRQIWHLSYPDGAVKQITNDTNDYLSISLSADEKNIVATAGKRSASIWSVDPETKQVTQLKSDSQTILTDSLSAPADGRIYFTGFAKAGTGVFSMDEDGGGERELIADGRVWYSATASPDGKYIVSTVIDGDGGKLYRMNPDGSDLTKLTDMSQGEDRNARITADGTVFFNRKKSDAPNARIMKVPITGGQPELVDLEADRDVQNPSPSPDGKYLAYFSRDNEGSAGRSYIRVVEFADGKPGRVILEKENGRSVIRWFADSSAIVYQENEAPNNLYKMTIADKREARISEFNFNAATGYFDFSGDGKRILVMRGVFTNNVVLIRDVTGVQ